MLTGNIVAICFSGLVCIVVSMLSPQNYNWADMKEIPTIEEQEEVRGSPGLAGTSLATPSACAAVPPAVTD
jgi:hypothetical protein